LEHYLRRQWHEIASENDSPDKRFNHILYKLNFDINTRKAEHRAKTVKLVTLFSRIAAVLILPLLIYSAIHFYNSLKSKESWIVINAPAWSRVQFSLPDGTEGWLNSNSNLKYNAEFANDREVVLKGEAFFDVESDKKRPFRVNTADVLITVLGTKFNIESYGDENTVEVTLAEGKLDYYNKGMNRLYSMKPNDYIFYDKATGVFKVDAVQPEKYTAWKDGKLVFRNDPLDVVARRLGRWYNIDVEIKGDISSQPMLRATFVDEKLEEVLRLLKLSLSIDYTVHKPQKITDGTYTRTRVIITTKTK
jgi:ferric-dicitrate binding protein FerR (iron transport regulator)